LPPGNVYKIDDRAFPKGASAMLNRGVRWCGYALLAGLLWPCRGEQVVFSRIQSEPGNDQAQFIELHNNTSNPFDIAQWKLSGGVAFDFPDFSPDQPKASFLRPFERIVLSAADASTTRTLYRISESVRIFGPWTGKLRHKKERIILEDKNGVVICRLKYDNGGLWPTPGKDSGETVTLIDPNREVDDWRNWTLTSPSSSPPGTPPIANRTSLAASPEIEANPGRLLLDYAAVWTYDDSGQDLGSGWREPGFDDTKWRRGPGLLGYDTKPLPQPGLRTQVNFGRQITYYFRCPFPFVGETKPGDRLILDQILDDGAVYYLNGRELARSRMPAGLVSSTTLSSSTVPTASEELNVFTLDPKLLVTGSNLLAAEVHQCNASSSDVVFGMRLRLVEATPPGLVINEVFMDASGGFVELCNTTASPQNLKGCFLSDQPANLRRYALPNDLLLPPGGLTAINLAEAGIRKADPLTVYLTAPDGQTVLNPITVNLAEDGRSLGRSPNGGKTWLRFPQPSRGRPNPKLEAGMSALTRQAPRLSEPGLPTSDIVITEIMYDPPYGADGTEYVSCSTGAKNQWNFPAGASIKASPLPSLLELDFRPVAFW
jgi:hypothetical protein